jgi:hypothetical protein
MNFSEDFNKETAIAENYFLEINRHVGYSKQSTSIDLCHLQMARKKEHLVAVE